MGSRKDLVEEVDVSGGQLESLDLGQFIRRQSGDDFAKSGERFVQTLRPLPLTNVGQHPLRLQVERRPARRPAARRPLRTASGVRGRRSAAQLTGSSTAASAAAAAGATVV